MIEGGLRRIAPFSGLEPGSLTSIVERLATVTVRDGDVVVTEGEAGDAMYFIVRGAFRVEHRADDGTARAVAELGEGEFFGEMSLLSGAPRFASVVGAGDGVLLRLGRGDLDAVVAAHPEVRGVLDHFYKERLVANVVRASRLFRLIGEARPDTLAEVVHVETHPAGTLLLEQGAPGKKFCLLLRGTCDVFHRTADGREVPYAPMTEGDVFGELSLLQDQPITATVRARTRCVLLAMAPEWFDQLLRDNPAARSAIYDLAGERTQRTRELIVREEVQRRLI
jgi:cAMP-dependent protein kinase regulator